MQPPHRKDPQTSCRHGEGDGKRTLRASRKEHVAVKKGKLPESEVGMKYFYNARFTAVQDALKRGERPPQTAGERVFLDDYRQQQQIAYEQAHAASAPRRGDQTLAEKLQRSESELVPLQQYLSTQGNEYLVSQRDGYFARWISEGDANRRTPVTRNSSNITQGGTELGAQPIPQLSITSSSRTEPSHELHHKLEQLAEQARQVWDELALAFSGKGPWHQ